MRQCSECTLCCKLLPVKELGKPSNTKCEYQGFKGCKIYNSRPGSCRKWSCSWLTDPATSELSRPDRSHYVIDPTLDFIVVNEDGSEDIKIPVLQIWCDAKHPRAVIEDNKLLDMLDENLIIALVRYNSHDGFVMFPPSRSKNGKWNYKRSNLVLAEHTKEELAEVFGCPM